ncbi:MAG TPA: dihydroorotate dehydrogenase [Patescibacteria group bacterium]|nr:dihydroorotate dehydrogenase [Patescibacteria group bacterium]
MHEVDLAGLRLESPVMNAAGTCKTFDEARKLVPTAVSAIVYGSYTYDEQLGDSGTTYYADSIRSINSRGIPNGGRKFLRSNMSELVAIAHDAGKAAIFSVSGNDPEQFAELVEICFGGGADAVEVNLACPNLWIDEGHVAKAKQKPIVCFYPDMIIDIGLAIKLRIGRGNRIGAKLSVFSNPIQLGEIASVIVGAGVFAYTINTNTFPKAVMLDDKGKFVIGTEFGGMAGSALKPMAQGNVKLLRDEFLPFGMPIVGVGGVESGKDVLDYKRLGACAVQVCTAYLQQGASVFHRILDEYTDLVPEEETAV